MEKIVGVIGGSGLYEIEGLTTVEEVRVDTPFGDASDAYICGVLNDVKLCFLPRHGKGHRFTPTEVNYRANIYGMKKLGVTKIISIGAVGSMKEDIKPGDMVIVDQFIDLTKKRESSFFENGVVGHISFAEPICSSLAEVVYNAAVSVGARTHKGGTYICIEGPQFSSKAESYLYRSFGVDVIGMTNATEAKLAKEAGICYSTVALSTDYDCWHISEESVSVGAVLAILSQNIKTAKKIIVEAVKNIAKAGKCSCSKAAENAILTDLNTIPQDVKEKLKIILGK